MRQGSVPAGALACRNRGRPSGDATAKTQRSAPMRSTLPSRRLWGHDEGEGMQGERAKR